MRSMLKLAVAGLLLAAGSARAGPGLPPGHDDTTYPDDQLETARPRRVDVVITDRGPEPRQIQVRGSEKLELVLTRQSANTCRGDVLVPEYDVRTQAPAGRPVAVTLITRGRGQIHVSCPMEDVGAAPVAP
jgi:plastocyanin domain-containing protein